LEWQNSPALQIEPDAIVAVLVSEDLGGSFRSESWSIPAEDARRAL
jgi:hypothetical protein